MGRMNTTPPPIEEVLDAWRGALMTIPGVEGVAIGRRHHAPCIVVYVRVQSEALEQDLPEELDGYRVVIETTGPIEAVEEG
jgi:hypothetical protein